MKTVLAAFFLTVCFIAFSGEFSAVIFKSKSQIALIEDNVQKEEYAVELGEDFSVPCGDYTVGDKLIYPDLVFDGVKHLRFSPGNFLGIRWISLISEDGECHTGIHGMSKAETHLFIAVKHEFMIKIYDFLPTGAKVKIHP